MQLFFGMRSRVCSIKKLRIIGNYFTVEPETIQIINKKICRYLQYLHILATLHGFCYFNTKTIQFNT